MLKADKVDLKDKVLPEPGHFKMLESQLHQGHNNNLLIPSNRASKCMMQNLTELKESKHFTIILEDTKASLSATDRTLEVSLRNRLSEQHSPNVSIRFNI